MLSDNERDEIIRETVKWYGFQHQIGKCIEECAELITELAREPEHRTDKSKIITELADVTIMCMQLGYLFSDDIEYENEINRKLIRLKNVCKKNTI